MALPEFYKDDVALPQDAMLDGVAVPVPHRSTVRVALFISKFGRAAANLMDERHAAAAAPGGLVPPSLRPSTTAARQATRRCRRVKLNV